MSNFLKLSSDLKFPNDKIQVIMEENLIPGAPFSINFPEKGLGVRYFQKLEDIKDQINQIDTATGITETASSVRTKAIQIAMRLISLNLTEKDVVVVSCKVRMDETVVILGVLFAGIQIATLDPELDIVDFQRCMNLLNPKFIFCDERVMSFIEQVSTRFRCPVFLFKKDLSTNSVKSLFLQKPDPEFKPVPIKNPEKTTAFIILTEGTTMPPKLVRISHCAAYERTMVVLQILLKDCRKVISYFPLMGSSQIVLMCASFEKNIVRILPASFSEREACRIIHTMKAELAILGTNFAIQLANFVNDCEDYNISCLKQIVIGGAPTPARTLTFINHAFSKTILNVYGVAECGAIAGISPEDVYLEQEKPASCGKVFPGGTVKVTNFETGKPVGPDTWGELCYKSAHLATGYVDDSGKPFLDKGYFRTGDVAQYDDQGCIYIHGRFDDIFFKDQKFFSALDVNEVLSFNADVLDSYVAAEEKEIVLYAVVRDTEITSANIYGWLADRLPEHMCPTRIYLVNEIVKTRNGKVKRYKMNHLKVRQSFIASD